MRENLEAKWRVSNLQKFREKAENAGALFQWSRTQRDVFFTVPRGRLKLRIVDGVPGELIAYFRPDRAGVRSSQYVVVRVEEPHSLLTALSSTVGVLAEVRKRRTFLLWRNVRVHLDSVEGLGAFVELESVVDGKTSRSVALANFEELASKLGLDPVAAVGEAYVDLLLASERETERP